MRRTALLALLAAAAGCGGSSDSTPLVQPAPVPEPQPAAGAPEAAADDARTATPPSADEVKALAALDRLTGTPPAAFYLSGEDAVLWAEAVQVEGTGGEVRAVLIRADGTSDTVGEWGTGSPEADERATAARRTAAAALAGKPMVELQFTAWPEKARALAITSPAMTVRRDRRGALTAVVGGKKVAIGAVRPDKPRVPRPVGVFASPDSPVALAVVAPGPGGQSDEGRHPTTQALRFPVAPR